MTSALQEDFEGFFFSIIRQLQIWRTEFVEVDRKLPPAEQSSLIVQRPIPASKLHRSSVVSEHVLSLHFISSARQPFPPPFSWRKRRREMITSG